MSGDIRSKRAMDTTDLEGRQKRARPSTSHVSTTNLQSENEHEGVGASAGVGEEGSREEGMQSEGVGSEGAGRDTRWPSVSPVPDPGDNTPMAGDPTTPPSSPGTSNSHQDRNMDEATGLGFEEEDAYQSDTAGPNHNDGMFDYAKGKLAEFAGQCHLRPGGVGTVD